MSFVDVSNSVLLYVLVGIGLAMVALAAVYYLKKCYRHALECGVSEATMKEVVKSSITFAIVPSIAIVTGLVTLVAVIGIPYAWLRLSVIGSVAYELMASGMAMNAIGATSTTATAQTFGLMMWAMCLPMTLGIVFNIFIVKKIHLGTLKLGSEDKKWGAVAQTVFMTTLIVTLIVPMFGKSLAYLLTFITSALIAIIITLLASRLKAQWLNSFTLAFCLIGAMAASVFYDGIFG